MVSPCPLLSQQWPAGVAGPGKATKPSVLAVSRKGGLSPTIQNFQQSTQWAERIEVINVYSGIRDEWDSCQGEKQVLGTSFKVQEVKAEGGGLGGG